MSTKLDRADFRFLAVCALLLAATVAFAWKYFYRAFPEAAIDFRVTREQSLPLAERFLSERRIDVGAYRQASQFSFDDEAKTFLERELGLEEANRLLGRRVRLWRWSHRWFLPRQKEEVRVDISPAGETIGFRKLLAEDAALESLAQPAARARAEEFLAQTMNRPPGGLEFLTASSADRPKRVDHTFTWRERDFRVKEADYRIEVTVQGGEVGGYREYLKVPEAWLRDYERLRSANETTQLVDTAVLLVLIVGMLVVFIGAVRRHDVRWRVARGYGLVAAALTFLAGLNEFPLAEFHFPTTDSYASFLTRYLLSRAAQALAAAVLIMTLVAAAEPLYRARYGSHVAIANLFTARGLRTRRFFKGAVLGVTLTGCFVAYQIGFYMLAYRFGAWSPADVPYSNLLNTYLPWVFVLIGGFMPAVSEEFLFRIFAIPYLEKLFRLRWLAIVLAGFLWGFGHSAYPQQPFWIRGVEVGVGGIVLGWIMLRWGILPALVWHYSVDALYSALLMLRSTNPYFIISGAVSAGVVVLPILVAVALYARRRGFEPDGDLENAAQPRAWVEPVAEVQAAPEPVAAATAPPWPVRTRIVAASAAVMLGALALIPVVRFGEFFRFRISSRDASARAAEFIKQQGLDTSGWRAVVFTQSQFDSTAAKYFLERKPVEWVNRALGEHSATAVWTVRWFRPLEKEEIRAYVDAAGGRLAGFEHTLDENAPGADVSAEQARDIASGWLGSRGYSLAALELKESSSEKRKARRDHMLMWEARAGDERNLDEARWRIRVRVAGDRVVEERVFWKLPEAYTRARNERNTLSVTLQTWLLLLVLAAVFFASSIMLRQTRGGRLPWRRAALVALPLAGLAAAAALVEVPQTWRHYNTAISVAIFQVTSVVGVGMGAVASFLIHALAAGLLLAVLPDCLRKLRSQVRAPVVSDALLAAALGGAAALAMAQLGPLLTARFHAQALASLAAPSWFGSAVPAVPALSGVTSSLLYSAAAVALAIHLSGTILRRRPILVAVALGVALALGGGAARTFGELAVASVPAAAGIGLVAGLAVIARSNLLAWVLALGVYGLTGSAALLMGQGESGLRLQGWIIVAVAGLTLGWVIYPRSSTRAGRAIQ